MIHPGGMQQGDFPEALGHPGTRNGPKVQLKPKHKCNPFVCSLLSCMAASNSLRAELNLKSRAHLGTYHGLPSDCHSRADEGLAISNRHFKQPFRWFLKVASKRKNLNLSKASGRLFPEAERLKFFKVCFSHISSPQGDLFQKNKLRSPMKNEGTRACDVEDSVMGTSTELELLTRSGHFL